MGVHGLTPFLRKIWYERLNELQYRYLWTLSPDVLHSLPRRFESLQGKTLIIDGTLITQRFFFMQDKHPHQHVISWYRLAKEFQNNAIRAIVIFDGKRRVKAKATETARREKVRELAALRASIEQERFSRLSKLKENFQQMSYLHASQRKEILDMLASELAISRVDVNKFLRDTIGPPASETLQDLPPQQPTTHGPMEGVSFSPPEVLRNIADQFKALFLHFRGSTAKISVASSDATDASSDEVDAEATPEMSERLASRSQHEATAREGKLWADCLEALKSVEAQPADFEELHLLSAQEIEGRLDNLIDRSAVVASSYERSSNAPTPSTYRESRKILTAMGFCAFQVSGPFEAEALASSMVHAGLGDYVVSEDTDVLAYDAPMIRNITSRDAFMMVSGSTVRESLSLSRDQFVDFCILLGTDFSQRITNMGPMRAFKFIREMNSIENIVDAIEEDPKYSIKLPKAAYLTQIDIARSVFNTLPPVPPIEDLIAVEGDPESVEKIFKRYRIRDIDVDPHWDPSLGDALAGNYFHDSPHAI